MKLTDVSWRSKIGGFRGMKSTGKPYSSGSLTSAIQILLPSLVIGMLLIISGVEINPGPPTTKVTFMDVSLKMVMAKIDPDKGNKNPTHARSRWGHLSQSIFGNNTSQLRQFLFNIHAFIPPGGMLKYCNTTLGTILSKLETFTDAEKSVINCVQTNSVWGHLAITIYGTNSSQDRHVLSTFWAIGNEVEEIGHGHYKSLLPKVGPSGDKLRRKRSYDKVVKKPFSGRKKNMPPPHFFPSSSSTNDPNSNSLLDNLKSKYVKEISQFPSFPCEVCDFMTYPNSNFRHKIKVTPRLRSMFLDIDNEYEVGSELIVCNRCNSNLNNNKIPPKAKVNLLNLAPVPAAIANLTMAEVRLIGQVKAFMKVYLLCGGRGQKAMKGLVIHFPQQVDEVIKQLPLNSSNADLIVVHEKHDRVEHVTSLNVRPKAIYNALGWLVQNNPLYKNITIDNHVNLNEQFQSVILESQTQAATTAYEGANSSWDPINPGIEILNASFSQGHRIFLANAGKQCTAMAASFLAHAFIDSPRSWCRQTLDDVILLGNDLYSSRRALIQHDYLSCEEVTGTFNAFGGAQVNLEINGLTPAIGFWGYATKVPGSGLPRLKQQIQNFISSGYKFGILTLAEYSMGIVLDGEYVYYFDSHGRGKKGFSTRGGEGSACVLKMTTDLAPSKISTLANRNCIPGTINPADRESFRFYLTVFNVNLANTEEEEDESFQNSDYVSPTNSPPRKIFHEGDIPSDSESDSSDNEEIPPGLPQFGRILEGDCVIDRDDVIEPQIDAIINGALSLHREDRSPINDYLERHLDLLAFPHLFPHGINGQYEERKIPITTLDYFQQRLMSSEKRFSGNTDFLFYALSEADKCRAREKIGIVAKQQHQVNPGGEDEDLGVRDPHVYMSSIRGTSSYWKKYTGDLISMVKTLGVPTFFFTFSFDDINSPDCINALWKAKHGYDTPDINPESIPYEDRKTLLNQFPIPAARHFSMRLSKLLALLKSNSKDIFGLELLDYSVRVEFQSRGSPHAHCLFWLKDAPDWTTPEGIQLLERNISCSTSTRIRDLVLKYQRHAHSKTCFKNKNQHCRFAFPKQITEETTILNEDEIVKNKGRFFNLKRSAGEEMINSYHPILLPLLLCNMDIQPVTGAVAIAYYIAKYMGKPESASIGKDIGDSITKIQNSNLPARQKMFRVAMTLMRNREISAQEAAFRICHLFLRYSSRATVFLPTFRKESRVRMLKKESYANGNPQFCTNIIDRYMGRPQIFENMCLYEFASELALLPRKKEEMEIDDDDVIEFPEEPAAENIGVRLSFSCKGPNGESLGRVFVRRNPAIIKHPNFNPITDKSSYYYSLLLLYRPFRDEGQWDGKDPCELFESERANFRNHTHNPNLRADLSDEIDRAILRIAEFDDEDRENINLDNEVDVPFENPEISGPVPSSSEAFRDEETHQNIAERIKEMHKNLNVQQKGIFRRVHETLKDSKNNFRLMVLANAGTGKSHLLRLLALLIRNMLTHDSLLIAAPTGKAAFAVGGGTCHSIFGLQVQHGFIKSYQKLNAKRLADFRRLYRNVQWIFIDEISMVSYENFKAIHLRLCEIFGTDGGEPFAGKNVVLFGDLMQLPPPKATKIFKNPCEAEVDLWRQFDFSELTINMRQRQDPLGKICDELRVGELSQNSLSLLKTRLIYNEENFKDAVRIYPENEQCKVYNNNETRKLRKSVATYVIKAKDFIADGPKQGQPYSGLLPLKDDLTGGIPNAIELGVGSRVMLRKNISTEKGFVNGATGIVRHIEWRIDKNRQIQTGDLPKRVLIKFDHEATEKWISCTTMDFIGKKQERVSREMIPLVLAWALTCHKLQGATLDKAVIYLGSKCKIKGLAYVAISRVTTLNGLAIEVLDPKKLLTTTCALNCKKCTKRCKSFNPADIDALNELVRLRTTLNVVDQPSAPLLNNLNCSFSSLNFVDQTDALNEIVRLRTTLNVFDQPSYPLLNNLNCSFSSLNFIDHVE